MKPSTTHTIEDLEAKVEEIAQELSGLESQHQHATSQIRRAKQKFDQLEAQRIKLAPRAFTGDEKAKVDLDDVELEQDKLARASRVAEASVPGLKRMVAQAKERLALPRSRSTRHVLRQPTKSSRASRPAATSCLGSFARYSKCTAASTAGTRKRSARTTRIRQTTRPAREPLCISPGSRRRSRSGPNCKASPRSRVGGSEK